MLLFDGMEVLHNFDKGKYAKHDAIRVDKMTNEEVERFLKENG
jgi:hypothetical protein